MAIKKYLPYILVLSGIVLFLLLTQFLYFHKFHKEFSANSTDWANYATFNGYFISVLNLITLGFISYLTFKITNDFNKLQIKPLVFFDLDTPSEIKGKFKDSWYLFNFSKAPAINVLVRFCFNRNDSMSKWISCYSLSGDSKKELSWIHWADKIEVYFTDATENNFYIVTFQDLHGITNSISKDIFTAAKKEAISLGINITTLRDQFEQFLKIELDNCVPPKTSIEKNYKPFIMDKIFKK